MCCRVIPNEEKSVLRTCVVGVLLLPDALDGTVECAEQAAPNAKVAAEHRRPRLDCRQSTDAAFAVGRIPEAFNTVPKSAADGLRRFSMLVTGSVHVEFISIRRVTTAN